MKISNIAIYGSITSLMIAFILPIVLIIIVKNKYNAKLSTLLIGASTFIFFAMIFEPICHSLVFRIYPDIEKNILVYALYGGLAAALFEEIGRYIMYKAFMKNRMDLGNSLMMGLGHGGIEAVFIILTMISNVVLLISFNNGMLDTALSGMDELTRSSMLEAISALAGTEPILFFLAGVERASAIFLQISLSVLVFQSFKNKKYLFISIALHFFVDFMAVIMNEYIYVLSAEIALILITAAICYLTYKIYLKENN